MKRWQTILLGLIMGLGFLGLAMWQAEPGKMLAAFQTARYQFVALSVAGLLVTLALRGVRWSVLTEKRLSSVDAFWLFNIGFLFNNVLPARLGEIARAFLTGRRPEMHFTSALSSIVVERLFDMVSVAIQLGMVLLVLPLPQWAKSAGVAMGAGAAIGIVVLALAARYPERGLDLGSTLLAILPRIDRDKAREYLRPFVDGLGGVSNPKTFISGLLLSVVAWIASGLTAWLLMLAFWDRVSLISGQLAVAAAGLGVAIPGAPGGIGPFEWAVVNALAAIQLDADVARSFALALHLLNFGGTSILGGIGLLREGVSFSEVASQARALRQSGGERG
jgi:uncharacterized protein (TIRG00374 family)